MKDIMRDEPGAPKIVDRSTFQAELDALRVREKAHTSEGDAIAAARRRLPMVEVDGATALIDERGAVTRLDAFEGRRMLIAFHTYSAYVRGTETTINTYNYLDYVPRGRDDDDLAFTMSWLRHHDRYDTGYLADADRPYWPAVTIQS